MVKMASREEVYKALDTERDYQDARWNEDTTSSRGLHSVTEWLVYMQDYLDEAKHTVSRASDEEIGTKALEIIRKITAMGVACMEQNGAISRQHQRT